MQIWHKNANAIIASNMQIWHMQIWHKNANAVIVSNMQIWHTNLA
jgi:hypothetical protein